MTVTLNVDTLSVAGGIIIGLLLWDVLFRCRNWAGKKLSGWMEED